MNLVLDAGGLIDVERGGFGTKSLIETRPPGSRLVVPAGVLAQVWRGGPQPRLSKLLRSGVEVQPLDRMAARAVGALLAASGTSDIVDAHVVLVARQHNAVIVTSDADDLHHLDPRAHLHTV